MSISIIELDSDQVDRILSVEEGHFLDLKSKEIKPSKLSVSISAFSNADGGELYIGIEEKKNQKKEREWLGFADVEAANGHLQLFETIFPLGEDYDYTFLSHPEKPGYVLQIQIRKSPKIINDSRGNVHLRRGAQNLPVSPGEELRRLERTKGLTSFENEPVSVEIFEISNSLKVIEFMLEVIPTSEPEPWLRKQRLITNNLPTVAGILIFSDLPQAVLPKRCGVKVYRYKTGEESGSRETLADDPVSIEGCAYDLIYLSIDATSDIINKLHTLGDENLEPVSYPIETLHEVITNAILHRDYSIADDVHIRIFDNRVEVESPGRLPAHITVENILDERFSRNGNLVRIINKFANAPNKDIGEGLNTAFAAMRKLQLKEPIIVQNENAVIVKILHERLASPEEIVMEYLSSNETINNRTGRSLTGITSENTMKQVFYRLRDRDLLEIVPGGGGINWAWRLKK